MKKIILGSLFMLLTVSPVSIQAQDIKSAASSILGGLLGSCSSTSSSKSTTASSIFNFLTGTKKVSAKSIVGTWSYSEPAAAFESKNLLSQAGGAVIANTIQNQSGQALQKYGIKPGAMKFTFKADSTFVCQLNGKNISGTYKVDGSNVYFSHAGIQALGANANLKGNNMQLTFKADKLLQFVKLLNKVNVSSSSLKLISTLADNYTGMQLGLQFAKQ
jgi:hypothetical protein